MSLAFELANQVFTEALLHKAIAAMGSSQGLISQTPDQFAQSQVQVRSERALSAYKLPAVDALVAGTIGAGLNAHADGIADSKINTPIDMGALLGDDFKAPSFVQAMQDMGSVSSVNRPATYAMNALVQHDGTGLTV